VKTMKQRMLLFNKILNAGNYITNNNLFLSFGSSTYTSPL
jgi:hypothetical protein